MKNINFLLNHTRIILLGTSTENVSLIVLGTEKKISKHLTIKEQTIIIMPFAHVSIKLASHIIDRELLQTLLK